MRIALAFLVAALLVRPLCDAADTAPAKPPPRVLLDMSHQFDYAPSNGLCWANTGYLVPKRYVVMETEAGLREEVLKAFDVLVLYQISADAQYTEKDADLVRGFLERGGGVMFLADAAACRAGLPLNRIAREYGFEFLAEPAKTPISARAGYGGLASFIPRLLRLSAGVKCTSVYQDATGRPVVISMPWKAGRIIAVSGSKLLTNPADSRTLANANTVEQLFQWLSSQQVADQSVDVKGMAKTYPPRIDPDRVIEAEGFRILYPDPLPEERLKFLREKAPIVYSKVSQLFGYQAKEQKTIIALMSSGGWTAGPRLVGIGALGDEIVVVSVLCHEFSNSLCSDAGDMPVWLGDAGWSAMVQVKVKTALGGKFAETVKGQIAREIAYYRQWESTHGLYDISSGHDVGHGGDPTLADTVGQGKIMAIISEFEEEIRRGCHEALLRGDSQMER